MQRFGDLCSQKINLVPGVLNVLNFDLHGNFLRFLSLLFDEMDRLRFMNFKSVTFWKDCLKSVAS